jgi:hypothetical protein
MRNTASWGVLNLRCAKSGGDRRDRGIQFLCT